MPTHTHTLSLSLTLTHTHAQVADASAGRTLHGLSTFKQTRAAAPDAAPSRQALISGADLQRVRPEGSMRHGMRSADA